MKADSSFNLLYICCKNNMQRKTLVLGASSNPDRYAYKAIKMLLANQHSVLAVGAREDTIDGLKVFKGTPDFEDIHTITLYLGPKNQKNLYQYILNLKPKRIIFNPGTENRELMNLALEQNIHVEEACTLVLLSTGQY